MVWDHSGARLGVEGLNPAEMGFLCSFRPSEMDKHTNDSAQWGESLLQWSQGSAEEEIIDLKELREAPQRSRCLCCTAERAGVCRAGKGGGWSGQRKLFAQKHRSIRDPRASVEIVHLVAAGPSCSSDNAKAMVSECRRGQNST